MTRHCIRFPAASARSINYGRTGGNAGRGLMRYRLLTNVLAGILPVLAAGCATAMVSAPGAITDAEDARAEMASDCSETTPVVGGLSDGNLDVVRLAYHPDRRELDVLLIASVGNEQGETASPPTPLTFASRIERFAHPDLVGPSGRALLPSADAGAAAAVPIPLRLAIADLLGADGALDALVEVSLAWTAPPTAPGCAGALVEMTATFNVAGTQYAPTVYEEALQGVVVPPRAARAAPAAE